MHKLLLSHCLSLVSFALLPLSASARPAADWIALGGRIHTMDAAAPEVEALAVKGSKIIARGKVAAILELKGPKTEVFDLKGRPMYPGFHEGHGHLLGLGQSLARLDLSGMHELASVLKKVKEAAKDKKDRTWLVGRGWDQNLWNPKEFPSKEDLDRLDLKRPIALTRVDGHALWVNSEALRLAHIDKQTPDPKGGRIQRDASGEASGILLDEAMELVRRSIPADSKEQQIKALQAAFTRCAEMGITSFHDAGVESAGIALYRELAEQGSLPFRIHAMLSGGDAQLLDAYLPKGPQSFGDGRLQIRSVKLMADGALGSRGAAMLEPYADRPQEKGLEILSEEQIYKASKRFAEAGFQTATHAIGDRSNRSVLNAYERVLREQKAEKKATAGDLRLRIEHAQILDAADIPRFGQLGVIASMQATHLSSDAPWVPTRIGQQRMDEGAYVWQKLLKTKALLVGGSDTPVEDINPLLGLYAAVTRQDTKGQPPGGWAPDQRLSLQQALETYTKNAAYAAFWEKETGTLEVGKEADLIVLSSELLEAEPQSLLRSRVELTMSGGRIRYQKAASSTP